jgi:N-acetylglucosaminyldiphosphoundecaprenol N-acetyl-beta-D-mannosaminyltransferase
MVAYRDEKFRDVLNEADMLLADGIGVVYASKIVKNPISQRAAGYDTACEALRKLAPYGASVYLFGAAEGVAEKAGEEICRRYPGIKIAGVSNGYFDAEREKQIIADINDKKPDVLFVCLGAPKQEKWIYENRENLNVNFAAGLGGTLDVFAGTVKRAPSFFIKANLEWFYRLLCMPSRIGRMMKLPKFLFGTMIKKNKGFENK